MSIKRGLAAALAAGAIATTTLSALQPKTPDLHTLEDQGAHAQQNTNRRLRDEGKDAGDADYRDRLVPGEHRPPEFHPRLPFIRP